MATEVGETELVSRDARVPWRVFIAVGVFVGVSAIVYGATSKEHAGTAMLLVASILALWCGTFLWTNARRLGSGSSAEHVEGDAEYLPEASPWPVGIGLGLALSLNGLLVGTWFLVPGLMLLAVSLTGFARQSRHRR
jgi:hypothetical protein